MLRGSSRKRSSRGTSPNASPSAHSKAGASTAISRCTGTGAWRTRWASTAAIAAVEEPDDFDVVAGIVAQAVVEGYLPKRESQRALEGGGVDRDLTVYRYQRLADALGVEGSDREAFETHLTREGANATAANRLLAGALAAQLAAYLEPASGPPATGPHGDAAAAAASITTGSVTVTVRTWT